MIDTKYHNISFEENSVVSDIKRLINQVWNNSPEFDFLFEGAQGTLLDIDSPYYPNVSSSSPGIAGIIFPTQIVEAPPPTNWMTQKRDKYGNWTK